MTMTTAGRNSRRVYVTNSGERNPNSPHLNVMSFESVDSDVELHPNKNVRIADLLLACLAYAP